MENPQTTATGLLKNLLALVIGAALLCVGIMFSVVLLAVLAVLALVAFGYFWWKTRALRKIMREHVPVDTAEGQVIDGEAIVVEVSRGEVQTALPARTLEG